MAAPIGLRDRERGRIGFTTSLGFSKKLERIARDGRVCMAVHAREHGTARGTVYALVQGEATIVERPSDAERALIGEQARKYLGEGRTGPLWDRCPVGCCPNPRADRPALCGEDS